MTAPERRSVRYAQNFLRGPRLVERLLARSTIGADDLVYEIGPGKGIITAALARRCRRVVAIEKDPILAGRLRRRFAGHPRVAIHEADALCFPLPDERYKVFASIPFNVTTAIVTRLTACGERGESTAPSAPDDAFLVVQREAANKIIGAPRESLYAVLLKPWFEPTLLHRFARADFVPAPRVDVVMLRLRKRGPPLVAPADTRLFRDFVAHGFTAWRPSLRRTFKGIFTAQQFDRLVRELAFAPDATPTALRFEHWLGLFERFKALGDARARWHVAGAERRLKAQQARLHKVHRTRASARSG